MKTTTSILILMLMAFQVSAFTPESGQYWDPEEPGSGYAIEIQDNYLFITFYVYDEDGFPVWYTSEGFLVGNSSFESRLIYFSGGQCIGCYWSQNTPEYSGYGTMTIEFLTETTAELTVAGVTKTIERFNMYLGDELQKMRGEWQVVIDASQYTASNTYPYFSDVMLFEQVEVYQGDRMVTGCRSESTVYYHYCTTRALQNNDLAAIYDHDYDELVAVMRDDADYYLAYYLKTGTDQFDGMAYSYRVGSEPDLSLDGFTVRGFRSASKSFVDNGFGPSVAGEIGGHDKASQSSDGTSLARFLPERTVAHEKTTSKMTDLPVLDTKTQRRLLDSIKKLEKQLQQ
ncbi:MAG: hypothetical protein DWP95_12165 [Proteobacteria bacterium]|nr:MAG: hypothetical protein DWP95_12165 [Pseudomonadota bacterium]